MKTIITGKGKGKRCSGRWPPQKSMKTIRATSLAHLSHLLLCVRPSYPGEPPMQLLPEHLSRAVLLLHTMHLYATRPSRMRRPENIKAPVNLSCLLPAVRTPQLQQLRACPHSANKRKRGSMGYIDRRKVCDLTMLVMCPLTHPPLAHLRGLNIVLVPASTTMTHPRQVIVCIGPPIAILLATNVFDHPPLVRHRRLIALDPIARPLMQAVMSATMANTTLPAMERKLARRSGPIQSPSIAGSHV